MSSAANYAAQCVFELKVLSLLTAWSRQGSDRHSGDCPCSVYIKACENRSNSINY